MSSIFAGGLDKILPARPASPRRLPQEKGTQSSTPPGFGSGRNNDSTRFAANIGGRMIGSSFFGITQYLALELPFREGALPATKLAIVAAGVALTLFAANLVLSFFLPEPRPGGVDD